MFTAARPQFHRRKARLTTPGKESWSLFPEPQASEGFLIIPPMLFHFDMKLQENLAPKEGFQFLSRLDSDLLQPLAGFSDDDSFLGIPFDEDARVNAMELLVLLELVDNDSR